MYTNDIKIKGNIIPLYWMKTYKDEIRFVASLCVTRTNKTEESSAGTTHFIKVYFQKVLRTNYISIS